MPNYEAHAQALVIKNKVPMFKVGYSFNSIMT